MPLREHQRNRINEYTVEVDLSGSGLGDEDCEEVIGLLKQYPNIVSVNLSENDIFFNVLLLKQLAEIETASATRLAEKKIAIFKCKSEPQDIANYIKGN
jgi:hypothetical protein